MPGSEVPFEELGRLGAFFAVARAEPRQWTGVRDLLDGAGTLDEAVDRYAGRLGTGRRDIAGSLLLQGWAGRLTSIYAGCAALRNGVPDLAADNLRYRFVEGAPVELGLLDGSLLDVEAGWQRLVQQHLEPLIAALDTRYRVGRRRLWGNVAAALAGSLGSLARAGVAPLDDLATRPWVQPAELTGLGEWLPTPAGLRFARRTCCNLVRVPGYGLCSDCVIEWAPRLRS